MTLSRTRFFYLLFFAAKAFAADLNEAVLESQFAGRIHPYLETYCYSCHGKEKHKGDLDLTTFGSLDAVAQDYSRWETVLDKLKEEEMPPEEAKKHPDAALSHEVINWIQEVRRYEAGLNAGDPGPVLAHRLSNAEYDYTIRDLTGFDIRPTREFPVDPANEAGFDNTGESLTMSPALLKKYLEAARFVAQHLVLKPHGLAFAPYTVIGDTDRDKYCVERIVEFYKRQRTDFADFFMAAWRYQHRAASGRASAAIEDFAAEAGVSPKYLATICALLAEPPEEIGPIAAIQAMWRELPADPKRESEARAACVQLRDFVMQLRQKLVPEVNNLSAPGIQPGHQALVLWKDRQMARNRMRYAGGAKGIKMDAAAFGSDAAAALVFPEEPWKSEEYEAAFARFCAIFPDAFVVSERARVFLAPGKEDAKNVGRLLSAGFHSAMGYFRDDGPMCELLLDDAERRELDERWRELDFIADAPRRQHSGFIWSERVDSRFMVDPRFDFARAEDKDAASEEKIRQLSNVYLDKAVERGADDYVLSVLKEHFDEVAESVRRVDQERLDAEPSHIEALQDLAQRAYRRPLSVGERAEVAAFYRSLRERDSLNHEDAVCDTLVSILMSPYFCYRADLVDAGEGIHPLSDYALASRLSYFIWSSAPDDKLLAHATAGDLHQPQVIVSEAQRMLKDDRVRAFGLEFAGNWLDIRRFEELNSVDRDRFKTFTNDLRAAMLEEPMQFFADVVRENRSVLDFLYANRTFVNGLLAKHYGMPDANFAPGEWKRMDNAREYGRGGLLPMAAFLTKNAPGDRTSPVKRGNWVIRRLLGERVPPPPAKVPELPSDEASLGNLTLREALARHRDDKACAGCHERFDSIGLAFEGFGPVGERRTEDLGGRAVDTHAAFPGGFEGTGVDGLLGYIKAHRESDFIDNFCRKLLAYALGRNVMLSDDQTIQEMKDRLAASDYRFDALIETIVTSRQFLNKRGQNALTER